MVTISTDKVKEARDLCDRGAWAELLSMVQEWQAETPSEAKSYFYQGIALSAMGRYVEADTSYRRALKIDPKDCKTWNNLAVLLFEALKRPSEGAQCLAQALKLDPGNKVGWANLASMSGRLGRHQQALECAERAVALDPHLVEAQLHRARAAQSLGHKEVVRAATEALGKVPLERFRRTR
jgi:tetratricopeptide (TPR) repeat protein